MSKKRNLSKEEEIVNAILHGIGLGLAIAALVVLIVFANLSDDFWDTLGVSIYGATLIILYLSSTLYHSFPQGKLKSILRVFDHSAIFLMIAGTYTPLTLILLREPLGWSIFGIVWGIALLGIILKIFWMGKFKTLSLFLYLIMGWLVVIAIRPLLAVMNELSFLFLVLGGLSYTIGVIFYAGFKFKYSHAVWHLFVLAGSACHFFTVLFLL